jgi:Na+-transporting NADH:ubiquinone oxidoreductase subunit NqrC
MTFFQQPKKTRRIILTVLICCLISTVFSGSAVYAKKSQPKKKTTIEDRSHIVASEDFSRRSSANGLSKVQRSELAFLAKLLALKYDIDPTVVYALLLQRSNNQSLKGSGLVWLGASHQK